MTPGTIFRIYGYAGTGRRGCVQIIDTREKLPAGSRSISREYGRKYKSCKEAASDSERLNLEVALRLRQLNGARRRRAP